MGVHRWKVYQHGCCVYPLRCRSDKHTAMVVRWGLQVISVIVAVIVAVIVVGMRMIVRMRMIVVNVAVWLYRAVRMAAGTV